MNEKNIVVILRSKKKNPEPDDEWDFWSETIPNSQPLPNRYDVVVFIQGKRTISGYVESVEKLYYEGSLDQVILTLEWVEITEKE